MKRAKWFRDNQRARRGNTNQMAESSINAAVADFILEIVVNHGEEANLYCNKGIVS